MKSAILYLVIPCYNEQEVLPITAPEFKNQLLSLIEKGKISKKSKKVKKAKKYSKKT